MRKTTEVFNRGALLTDRTPTSLKFTKEIEESADKISFLDCLVSRDNNRRRTAIYRKSSLTDRPTDES